MLFFLELNPEFCPKWTALSEILKVEIPADVKETKDKDTKVLILCQDHRSCYQLEKVVHSLLYCIDTNIILYNY